MRRVWRDWKRDTARTSEVEWERDVFEHRWRNGENVDSKALYRRENPVRAGLVPSAKDWAWYLEA